MKNQIFRNGLAVAVIILFLGIGFQPCIAYKPNNSIPIFNGNTLYVGGTGPGNYTSIQDAIDNASNGDTIYVYSGIYQETVLINKAIELIGQNSLTTIIESSHIATVVWIKADNVIVKQFTIKADIQCICIGFSKNNIISDNILTRYNSNFIKNQNLPDDGIDLVDSTNITIINNSISNRTAGIVFQNSSNNIISENSFKNCGGCVVFDYYCNYNIIKENKFIENYYCSIYITDYSNNNNHIYHNIFFNSNQNAYDYSSNIWDNGYPSGGNYWHDYTGEDADGDGIGDTPYPIPGGNNEDRYPLMEPFGENHPPTTPVIEGKRKFKEGEGGTYPYTIYSIDPDGDDILFLINWSDGTHESLGPYESGEKITINITIPFEKGTYDIFKVKAIDIYNAESDWAVLEIEVPRNRASTFLWYKWFLERFPLLERILKL